MDVPNQKSGKKSKAEDGPIPGTDAPLPDPVAFTRNMINVLAQSQKALGEFLRARAETGGSQQFDRFNIGGAFTELLGRMLAEPRKIAEAQTRLWQDYMALWQTASRRLLGEEAPPVITPDRGDKRFRGGDWDNIEIFDFIKQSYLLTARWLQHTVAEVEGLDERTRQKIDFHTKQFVDAIAPTNFVLTNPDVLRTTVQENGENLVRGLQHLLEDLERGKGKLSIRQTDLKAFEVGRNMAITPGKVVFRNRLIELIQYEPRTETVFERPLLVIPAFINKYYILDLNEQKSFVKWALGSGLTVFVISWVNPDEKLAQLTFGDYMTEGVFAALDAIEQATGMREVNAIGYCVGGTLLGAALAYQAKTGDDRLKSGTFLAAQVDFTEAGELQVFVDDAQLQGLQDEMEAHGGYLPGNAMFNMFNLLRSNDLIWSYVVNNYLLGREPMPFDLLYWNSDQTRLPLNLHLHYLREFYQRNELAEGKHVINNVQIDLGDIKVPLYLQSCKEDHIAPMRSVFKGTHLFGGPVRFVVAGSGHIAGVINPPQLQKYQYWTNDDKAPSLTDWWQGAQEHPGSWWPDWLAWLAPLSGAQVPARAPGGDKLKPLCDAPGTYVKVRED